MKRKSRGGARSPAARAVNPPERAGSRRAELLAATAAVAASGAITPSAGHRIRERPLSRRGAARLNGSNGRIAEGQDLAETGTAGLGGVQRQQADVRSWGLPTAAVDPKQRQRDRSGYSRNRPKADMHRADRDGLVWRELAGSGLAPVERPTR